MQQPVYTLRVTNGSLLWHQRFGPALVDKIDMKSEAAPNVTVIGQDISR